MMLSDQAQVYTRIWIIGQNLCLHHFPIGDIDLFPSLILFTISWHSDIPSAKDVTSDLSIVVRDHETTMMRIDERHEGKTPLYIDILNYRLFF